MGPSEVSNSPNCVQVSVRFENSNIKLEQNKTETVCQLRKTISEKEKLDPSSVRLLLHGQRFDDKETIETLALSDSDVIEAFLEMSGGGKPEKPKTLVDEKEIRDALEKSFEDTEYSDSESDTDEPMNENIPAEEIAEGKNKKK